MIEFSISFQLQEMFAVIFRGAKVAGELSCSLPRAPVDPERAPPPQPPVLENCTTWNTEVLWKQTLHNASFHRRRVHAPIESSIEILNAKYRAREAVRVNVQRITFVQRRTSERLCECSCDGLATVALLSARQVLIAIFSTLESSTRLTIVTHYSNIKREHTLNYYTKKSIKFSL